MDRRTKQGMGATILLAGSIIASSAWAVPPAIPASGPTQGQQVRPPALTPAQPVGPLPHQQRPDDWPQPDYFTEALKLTSYKAGDNYRLLKLAPGVEPELLVLPVQMQVFGLTPAFAALVGASLDHELARRGLDANRQTDLFDIDGPYVRRFEEAQIKDFAAGHAKARVLALYLGRDAVGKNFVTLTLSRGSQIATAHRSVDEVPEPLAALASIAATLPGMLSELGFADKDAVRAQPQLRCEVKAWDLMDPTRATTRARRACHALVMGVLLPEFIPEKLYYARPRTPAKLAWLAQAYVEADALAPATAQAIRTIAWSQFELTAWDSSVGTAIDADDPVAQPLARLLWARERAQKMPVRSHDDATEEYVAAAAASLPPFAKAVLMERANYQVQFRRVDICALELAVPMLRLPEDCRGLEQPPLRRKGMASQGEHAILEEWRLARSFKDLVVQGRERGDLKSRNAVLDALPPRIAAHPFIRQERFATEEFDSATGDYQSLVKRAHAAVSDFIQTTADLQRWGTYLSSYSVHYGRWTKNKVLRAEPSLVAASDDEHRMIAVLEYDAFKVRGTPPQKMSNGPLSFLRPGPIVSEIPGLPMPAIGGKGPMPAIGGKGPMPEHLLPPRHVGLPLQFSRSGLGGTGQAMAALEKMLENDSSNMDARVELALARMKEGQSLEQARSLIDARPAERRSGQAIGESHAWAVPAHALFFAGEFDAARHYYERVAAIGTGSGSDMHARIRLRMLSGDIPGALRDSRLRLERYESDFARRDVAGFEFMLGHNDRAWAALKPRLSHSGEIELWVGAAVGQRIEGKTARQFRDWIMQSSYGHAQIDGVDIPTVYLSRFIVDDRVPTDDDISLMGGLNQTSGAIKLLQASAKLKQLAFADRVDAASLQSVRELIASAGWAEGGRALKPLYVWVTWRATEGSDPTLAALRGVGIDADFDSLLAQALLLGLDNKHDDAITYLRAARIEMAELGLGRLRDENRSAPYAAALTSYLLFSKTGDPLYRDEALRVARAYQRIFPFLAWPYALDALLSADGEDRLAVACKARFLDRDSFFLQLSQLKPDPASPICRKFLW